MTEPKQFEREYLEDQFDNIDASFFTGDDLFTKESIKRAQWYLDRWNRRLIEIREIVDENEKDS